MKPEVMEVDIAVHVGVGHILGEDGQQGEFLLYSLGQGKVRRLRSVGHIGVLLVGVKDEAVHVVDRHTEPGVHLPRRLQALLDELGIDEFPDQRAPSPP